MTPPRASSIQLYLRLLGYVRPYWRVFAVSVVAMTVVAATEPAFAALVKPLLDGTFVQKDPDLIGWMPLAIVGLFFLRGTKEKLTLRATLDNGRQINVASDVEWTSSDLSVAEINDYGILIGKKFGTVTISALEPASGVTTTASGGDGIVTIVDEVERLRVLDADLQLRTGDRPRLRAVGQFRNPAALVGEPEI